MRDAFAVLFFVSVGMLFDPAQLPNTVGLILATAAIVLLGKPLAAVVVVLVLGRPVKTALAVAVALAQIGEFSFILSAVGRELGVLPPAAAQALVVAAILSITLNPLLFKSVDSFTRWLGRRSKPAAEDSAIDGEDCEAIVIGYGPVGRTVTRLLRANGVELRVIDLNDETVTKLRRDGIRALYGDASQLEVLRAAGVANAKIVISTAATNNEEAIITAVKELNPGSEVIVRANYVGQSTPLNAAGADVVITGEGEVGLALAERVLARFGASPEQLERERQRLRAEFGM